MRKQRIIHSFGRAERYQQEARLQQRVADTLARLLPPLTRPTLLELGCGTGFLSRHLLQRWPAAPFLCSDIALPMVQRCRAHLGDRPHLYHAVLDGERPAVLPDRFDLVAASMVWQWFDKPLDLLQQWHDRLRPGGCLAMATLGPATFQTWRAACDHLGMANGLPAYPTVTAWQRAWPAPGLATLREEEIILHHASALAFLRGLRAIGAQQPAPGYRPQPAGLLRRLLRHLEEEKGFSVNYQVVYGVFRKDP
ncbi:MAG: methyltransferase [Magnetococcus sp. DMHC-8]